MKGWVFNIQRYSLHDGAGIRTLVFLKGCPLRCDWCSNPESQRPLPELAVNVQHCLGEAHCALCITQCPDGCLSFDASGLVRLAAARCRHCLHCAPACPTRALQAFGKAMDVGQVMDSVEADGLFYARSQGGMTLSGGEPLMQGEFALALLKEAKKRRINTLLETCGQGPWRVLSALAEYCDGLYYDIKSLDNDRHRQFTGRGNRRILKNLLALRRLFPALPVHVRTPLIPGFNHRPQDISAIIDFIGPLGVTYEILPYHRLGRDKYRLLGRDYPLGDARLTNEETATATELARQRLGERYISL